MNIRLAMDSPTCQPHMTSTGSLGSEGCVDVPGVGARPPVQSPHSRLLLRKLASASRPVTTSSTPSVPSSCEQLREVGDGVRKACGVPVGDSGWIRVPAVRRVLAHGDDEGRGGR